METQRNKKLAFIILAIVEAVIILLLLIVPAVQKRGAYKRASGLMNEGNYEEAITAFTELKDYKDSRSQAEQAKYMQASRSLENGD